MSTELNTLTQIQLYELLTADPTAMTVLAHDGTTKSGKKLGAAVVHIDRSQSAVTTNGNDDCKRESVALLVREQEDGTAESGLRELTDAIADINRVGKHVFPARTPMTASVKGVFSDHNVTERKTNALIQQNATEIKDLLELFR